MADPADRADPGIEAATEAAIAKSRTPAAGPWAHVQPRGFCIWCGDPVDGDRLHCRPVENDCEADHMRFRRYNAGRNE